MRINICIKRQNYAKCINVVDYMHKNRYINYTNRGKGIKNKPQKERKEEKNMNTYTIKPIITGYTNTSKGNYLYHHPGSYQPEGAAIYEQLEKLGMKCEDIDTIIFTHLHWDHVYYLDRFTNAKLYVQKAEYEFAVNPIPLYYKSYEYPVLGLTPQFDGKEFVLLEGECEVMDGISVYPSTGHSVGHQTVTVNTKEGVYHCCGDLIFTYDNLKEVPQMHYDITPPGRFLNIVDSWNSIAELKKRITSIDKVLATHAHEMIELVESGKVIGE